jgi:hypothetical protein
MEPDPEETISTCTPLYCRAHGTPRGFEERDGLHGPARRLIPVKGGAVVFENFKVPELNTPVLFLTFFEIYIDSCLYIRL